MEDEGETLDEQLDRLRAMAADEHGSKWDLSPNDRAAIAAVVGRLEKARAAWDALPPTSWEAGVFAQYGSGPDGLAELERFSAAMQRLYEALAWEPSS